MNPCYFFFILIGLHTLCLFDYFSSVAAVKRHGYHSKDVATGRIVGGEEATIARIPFVVALWVHTSINDDDILVKKPCAGTIIDKNFVLTTAHCLQDGYKVIARIGSSDPSSGGETFESSNIMFHPLYNPTDGNYDVALILFEDGIGYTYEEYPWLAYSGEFVAKDDVVTVFGFGAAEKDGNSQGLQAVNLTIVDAHECNKLYGNQLTAPYHLNQYFCAGDSSHGTCTGDEGAPAVTDKKLLRGIATRRLNCDNSNPGVFVDIAYPPIGKWIFQQMFAYQNSNGWGLFFFLGASYDLSSV